VIIVGIGYHTNSILGSTEFRTPDYTPTRDTAFDGMLTRELKMTVRSGEAPLFLETLKKEIFPRIEKAYRTEGRGLAGHSFGGLFGTYVLFREPALFNKYLLSSSSLFWDGEALLKQEEAFYSKGARALPAHVFVTVGEQEYAPYMKEPLQRFLEAVRGHRYEGLTLEERSLPNETHASAFLTAFNQGLRVLYKK
jgi:hypothetical protein